MLSRIHWIIETYARRPLVIAFFALGAVILTFQFVVSGMPSSSYRTTNYSSFPRANLMVNSKATLEAVRRSGRQSEVDALDLASLWIDIAPKTQQWDESLKRNVNSIDLIPDEAFYRILDEFPNLRQVLGVYVYPVDARLFAKLSKLEYLMLHGTAVSHLDSLKVLTHLKRLDCDVTKRPVGFDALRELPKLEMIVFTSRSAISDDLLKTVARFPHLRTLVLSFSYWVPPNWPKDRKFAGGEPPLTEVGFEALASAPALDTLYVGGYVPRDDEDHLLNFVRKSRATVYPAVVNKERLPTLGMAFITIVLFSIPIGHHLAIQFQSPMRRMLPRFSSSHAYVGGGLCAAIVVVETVCLVRSGINVFAAGLLSIGLVGTFVCLPSEMFIATSLNAQLEESRPARRITSVRGIYWLLITGFWMMVGFHPRTSDWLVAGNGALLAILCVVASAVTFMSCKMLNQLVSLPGAPQMMPAGFASQWERMKTPGAGRHYRKNWVFATAAAESGIERLPPKTNGESWWQQIERLRAAIRRYDRQDLHSRWARS